MVGQGVLRECLLDPDVESVIAVGRAATGLKLPFKAAVMFRPGFIQPMHGIKSRTRLYRMFYVVLWPLYPIFRVLLPNLVTTTETVGKAMIRVATGGAPKVLLENRDINALAAD
jgi:hypothetical protein